MVFLTLCAWIIAVACVYSSWDRRHKPKPNPVLGYVESVTSDENGVYVKGRLTEEGKKHIRPESDMPHLSVGFRPTVTETEDGSRLITNAKLHSVSLDVKPGPYGGRIVSAGNPGQGTQPGQYAE